MVKKNIATGKLVCQIEIATDLRRRRMNLTLLLFKGYSLHCISAIAEWCLAVCNVLFILRYVSVQFDKIWFLYEATSFFHKFIRAVNFSLLVIFDLNLNTHNIIEVIFQFDKSMVKIVSIEFFDRFIREFL